MRQVGTRFKSFVVPTALDICTVHNQTDPACKHINVISLEKRFAQ
jgi:hypothetical protein